MSDINYLENIKEAFGLKEDKCIVKEDDRYIIKPKDGQDCIQIDTIKSINDDNDYKIYIFQSYNLVFEHCVFNHEIELLGACIEKTMSFEKCIFKNQVSFYGILESDIIFQDTIFENRVHFRTDFKSLAEFSGCKFQNEADFSGSTFYGQAIFKETIFKVSAYFDHTKFKSDTIFRRSEFCENAHFYQAKFSRDPNFFQAMFNEHLNLTDTKIHNEDPNVVDAPIFNFDFEGLKEKAQTCSEADKYRDVFKNIKNALIKSGNLLGASRFRKMELYCKEIELDLKKKENKESSIRDTTDRIQLMFYRLTSDHHTDLLLILNNVIFLIALFGVANFTLLQLNQFDTLQFKFLACCISLLKVSICITFVIMSIFILLHRKLTLKKSYRICLKTIKDDFIIILLYLAFMLYVLCNYSASSVCLLCITFAVPFLYSIVYMLAKRFHIKIAKNIALALAYLVFGFMFIIRYCVLGFAYCAIVAMLFCNPSSILPVLGKLIDSKNGESCLFACGNFKLIYNNTFPSIETLNLAYMLLLFLLLFSLQKTARKNTIVPN